MCFYVDPSRGGHPKGVIVAQQATCVKAIIVGGLDTIVDVGNALNLHEWKFVCSCFYFPSIM